MPSHITVIPASTQAGRETIRALLSSDRKPLVRGVYRNLSKVPAQFSQHPNFNAVQGDVSAGASLDFAGSDAVLYIPPPTYDGQDQGDRATKNANAVKEALEKAPSVQKLIVHSAFGAHHDQGIGVLKINNISDTILKAAAPHVKIVKPGWYFELWADALKTMQADNPSFESPFSPEDHAIPMVSVKDIGEYCAEQLLAETNQKGTQSVDMFGPRLYSSLDVKKAIESVTGKQGKLVLIEKDQLEEYFGGHVPKMYASEFAEMITSLLPGGVMAGEFTPGDDSVKGKRELADVLKELASQ